MSEMFETILIKRIGKAIQKVLNEYNIDYQKFSNVNMQQVMKDAEQTISWQDKEITTHVQNILNNLHKQYKFKDLLNGFATEVSWSKHIATACTDMNGRLFINPDYIRSILDRGDKAIEFIILHEAMHNYLDKKNRQIKVINVNSNIAADEQVNHEILLKWPEYKQSAKSIGALIRY